MKSRVLFFDLDDTLYPAEAVYKLGLKAAWQCMQGYVPMPWPQFQRTYHRARQDVKGQLGIQPAARSRILYIKRLVEIVSERTQPALTLELIKAYNTCWRHIDVAKIRPIIQRLSRQFTLGVMTNQVAGFQLQKMNRIDPHGRWFKLLVTSEEVGCEKPDRRFFQEACRIARCRPSEAMMIGDSWPADILGAHKAGWRAVYIHNGPHLKRLPKGVAHARSLSGLEKALAQLRTL